MRSQLEPKNYIERWSLLDQILHYFVPLLFFNVLIYCYSIYNVPIWGYLGYTEDFSYIRYAFALVALGALLFFTPKRIKEFSDLVLVLTSSTVIVTMISVYAVRGYSFFYFFFVLIFYFILFFFGKRVSLYIPKRKSSVYPFLAISFFVVFLVIFNIARKGGFGRVSFSLIDMYDNRSGVFDIYFTGVFAYLNNWAIKLFVPAILAFGIIKKSTILIGFAVFSELLFFAVFSQKTPVLFLFFVPFCIWVGRGRFKSYHITLSFLTLFIFVSLVYEIWGFLEPLAIVQNRAFFAPAINNVYFYEFFRDNGYVYFSNSFLSGIVDYPFFQHVFDLISISKTGDVGVNPNTGVLGTGYMHMGYAGLFLYSLLAGILLTVLNSLSRTIQPWVSLSLATPPFYIMMTSADFSVSLITNGLLLSIFILFFWPGEDLKYRG